MGKPLYPHKKKKTMKRWASLLPATAVSSCEPDCCRWVWEKLCTQDWYGSTISSFTGNHSVWLDLFCYRYISLDIQELYHLMSLIGFGIGQSLIECIGQYRLEQARDIYLNVTLSLELLNEHYHRSPTEVINRYHRSINKTYIRRIFNIIGWTSYYLVILIDKYYYKKCSWISHLELTFHRSGQTLHRIKLLLDCYRSRFDVLWNNWMTIAFTYYLWFGLSRV